ncbi:hypothetical protein GWK47_037286 [Chionoecetes opilio]|uniref:Uncharacterized protein n=1 Tax=Chionoecetes opilio TaxID=41210 RepID=A0A8J5CMN8_CHIOP|nr:hypothetical protein GWK47_037286 [Chionoecetes opilio]
MCSVPCIRGLRYRVVLVQLNSGSSVRFITHRRGCRQPQFGRTSRVTVPSRPPGFERPLGGGTTRDPRRNGAGRPPTDFAAPTSGCRAGLTSYKYRLAGADAASFPRGDYLYGNPCHKQPFRPIVFTVLCIL